MSIDLSGAGRQNSEHYKPLDPPQDPIEAFLHAMGEYGLDPGEVVADGQLHRFNVDGDRPGSLNGWYVLFPDPPAGRFGCWKRGIDRKWSAGTSRDLSPEEKEYLKTKLEEAQRKRNEEAEKVHKAAREESERLLSLLDSAPADHLYLEKKKVSTHGALVDHRGVLAIPMWDISGTLRGFEYIAGNGRKWRLTGTDPKGAFHVFGNPMSGPDLLIGEGWATCASLHQATTGKPVIAAFSKTNLRTVAEAWRDRLPNANIIICADRDADGNGQARAMEASKAVGGRVVIPPNVGDFNDLAVAKGLEAVKRAIENPTKLSPREKLKALTVQEEYVAMIGKEEWLVKHLIIKNQILVIVAKSGGGKTTISFYYLAPYLIKQHAITVYYFDLDSPASDHSRMLETVQEIGSKFQWVNPLTHGKGPEMLIDILKEFVACGERLDDVVFFLDTLKKFIDMLDKKSVKPFFELMRQLTALGATVVLLGHANKHRDNAGNLVFEGVGDVMSDADALIFFERITAEDGQYITTVVDPDKGAKVRGLYEPLTFHISKSRDVSLCKETVAVPDWSAGSKKNKLTNEEIEDKIRGFLQEMSGPVSQTVILDSLKGELGAGINRIRTVLNACAVPQQNAISGQIYSVDGGLFNRKTYWVAQ